MYTLLGCLLLHSTAQEALKALLAAEALQALEAVSGSFAGAESESFQM